MSTWTTVQSKRVTAHCLWTRRVCDSGSPSQQEVVHKSLALGKDETACGLLWKQVERRLAGRMEQLPRQELGGLADYLMTGTLLYACKKDLSGIMQHSLHLSG